MCKNQYLQAKRNKETFFSIERKKIGKIGKLGKCVYRLRVPNTPNLGLYTRARERLFPGGVKVREKEIEKKLVDGIKKLGGRAYKFVSPGNAGVPDRIVILPDQKPIFVELKTEAGKITELQKSQCKRLIDLGQKVEVLYGEKEVDWFLEYCKDMVI